MTALRLVQDAGERRAQVEAALALGASPHQCTASVMRRSMRLAMVPVIDSTKTIGIVFLPGGHDRHDPRRRRPATGGATAGGRCRVHAAGRRIADRDHHLAAGPGRLFTAQMQVRRLES